MYSVMWSEHCSYKSSKVHLRRFGELPDTTPNGSHLLAGLNGERDPFDGDRAIREDLPKLV